MKQADYYYREQPPNDPSGFKILFWLLFIIFIISLMFLASCSDKHDLFDMDGTRIYHIPAGKHSDPMRGLMTCIRQDMRVEFRFTATADMIYCPEYNNGWNKIMGKTIGSNPRDNSLRLGWITHDDGSAWLGAYLHQNGNEASYADSSKMVICELVPGKQYYCVIDYVENEKWIMQLNEHYYEYKVEGLEPMFEYLNHPYIGGRFTFPHDVDIEIELITPKTIHK